MIGITRSISSFSDTLSWLGRVDSPPTSIISAPSASIFNASSKAFSLVEYNPPSENESGVTFNIPMICVRFVKSYNFLFVRSEEHTSELQSRGHLVCRLLLEKKNHEHMYH